jgi:hypothetical protein
MTTDTDTAVTTRSIASTSRRRQAIRDAITKPEWNQRYAYPWRSEYDLRPGGQVPRDRRP